MVVLLKRDALVLLNNTVSPVELYKWIVSSILDNKIEDISVFRKFLWNIVENLIAKDFDNYLKTLDGGGDSEIAIILIHTQWTRICFAEPNGIPLGALMTPFAVSDAEIIQTSLKLMGVRKAAIRARREDVIVGITVW